MKIRKRRLLLLTGLSFSFFILLGILILIYPSYVESQFQATLEQLAIADKSKLSSTCLGSESERIQVFPILYSKIRGKDPFKEQEGRRTNYYHGQRFNFQKTIDYGRRDSYVRLMGYWSVWENQWHLGGIVMDADWKIYWQCLPGTCSLEEHTGRGLEESLVQYEGTLGSLFADCGK